jgi:hypothetical protein
MLHVRIDAVEFDGFSIQIENLMTNFSLFKADPTGNYLFSFTFPVN